MRSFMFAFIGGILGTIFASITAIAWVGPTGAPPNNNVSSPLNVGSVDQVKNGGVGVNALAVFGNTILSGASRYLNFGTTTGAAGYGVRDNAGVIEIKNDNGTWTPPVTTSAGLGENQNWSDLSPGRPGVHTCGTNYTNNTGKPIQVAISVNGHGTGILARINGVDVRIASGYSSNTNMTGSFIVPSGATYSLLCTNVSGLSGWFELR